MANVQAHTHHFYLPHIHLRTPHIEWHDLAEAHERAANVLFAVTTYGLTAALLVGLAAPTANLVGSTFTYLNEMGDAAVVVPSQDLPKEWRTTRSSSYEAMYGRIQERDLGWIRNPSAN
jgi:hypothetical protein